RERRLWDLPYGHRLRREAARRRHVRSHRPQGVLDVLALRHARRLVAVGNCRYGFDSEEAGWKWYHHVRSSERYGSQSKRSAWRLALDRAARLRHDRECG